MTPRRPIEVRQGGGLRESSLLPIGRLGVIYVFQPHGYALFIAIRIMVNCVVWHGAIPSYVKCIGHVTGVYSVGMLDMSVHGVGVCSVGVCSMGMCSMNLHSLGMHDMEVPGSGMDKTERFSLEENLVFDTHLRKKGFYCYMQLNHIFDGFEVGA
jgi:hypothetical protein